ncbi:general secretion pathway protein GspK [Arenimonas fontis]|uniref:General secretion pathway protein GspK n=1 Tax=Arenimonas fontis TaxID=2608255 RepID=A0A5B2ZCZ1_9GAMM|nr:type II secretion system protein GspK [Arenimonas fontis]KAA2284982.1 general secretion pathway protein GspK [Arenimonas fontis]
MDRQRGAALLMVMWLLILLAGLVAVFAFTARVEAIQGSALRAQAAGRYAAEAGIELAALRMADGDPLRQWYPDGRPQQFEFEGHAVEVRVQDEAGKVDLNAADASLLARLMTALDIEDGRARQLAGAIQDWRDSDSLLALGGGAEDRDYGAAGLPYGARDRPFATVQELQQVLGMDPDTYRRLVPHVTVHAGLSRPTPDFAQAPVLRALGLSERQAAEWLAARAAWQPGQPAPVLGGGLALAGTGSGTYSVASRATRPDGSLVEVTAILRIGAGAGFGQLYAPLAWRVGEPD